MMNMHISDRCHTTISQNKFSSANVCTILTAFTSIMRRRRSPASASVRPDHYSICSLQQGRVVGGATRLCSDVMGRIGSSNLPRHDNNPADEDPFAGHDSNSSCWSVFFALVEAVGSWLWEGVAWLYGKVCSLCDSGVNFWDFCCKCGQTLCGQWQSR